MQGSSKIPFVKPSRVGNFKIWRARYQVSAYPDLPIDEAKAVIAERGRIRKEKFDIECINVSNLEGTWKVQIPATFEMFSVLNMLYSDLMDGAEPVRKRSESILACLLGNMMYSSTIGNGYYHRALEIVATCYAHPSMLNKEDGCNEDLLKDIRSLIDAFLDWRTAYDESVRAKEPTAEELRRDEIAEQAEREMEDAANSETATGQDEN